MTQSSHAQFLVRSFAQLRTIKVRIDHTMNSAMGDVNHGPLSILHCSIRINRRRNGQTLTSKKPSCRGCEEDGENVVEKENEKTREAHATGNRTEPAQEETQQVKIRCPAGKKGSLAGDQGYYTNVQSCMVSKHYNRLEHTTDPIGT